jgi:hypothetical protein
LELIDGIVFETPLSPGPDFNVFNSRFTVSIPADKFNSESKYAQLFSFKDGRKKSPAVSKIIEVFSELNLLNEDLPTMTSSLNTTNVIQKRIINNIQHRRDRAISFSFEEAALSTPVLWDAIIEAARFLTPTIVNALASLVGEGDGQSVINENIVRIVDVIKETLKQGHRTEATTDSRPAQTPIAPAISRPESLARDMDYLSFQRRISRKNAYPRFNVPLRQQFAAMPLSSMLDPDMQECHSC